MFDWLWKPWTKKPKYPPQSLAFFQVYGDGPEPRDNYPGPVWRQQVPFEVKLDCHLLPVVDEPSFLSLPKQPPLRVYPPVFQVSGELRAPRPQELPLEEWLSQGILWWLRRLGKPQVTGFLAFLLVAGHAQLDRQRFPEIDQAFQFLLPAPVAPPSPPVPAAPSRPPVEDSTPTAPPSRARPWAKFPLQLEIGPARVQFLDRRDGKCCWRVDGRSYWKPLCQEVPLSLLIEIDRWDGTEEELEARVLADFKAKIPELLARLQRYPAANRRLRPWLQKLMTG